MYNFAQLLETKNLTLLSIPVDATGYLAVFSELA